MSGVAVVGEEVEVPMQELAETNVERVPPEEIFEDLPDNQLVLDDMVSDNFFHMNRPMPFNTAGPLVFL